MDETDHRILRELQRNGRLSNTELAERVNLSPALLAPPAQSGKNRRYSRL